MVSLFGRPKPFDAKAFWQVPKSPRTHFPSEDNRPPIRPDEDRFDGPVNVF